MERREERDGHEFWAVRARPHAARSKSGAAFDRAMLRSSFTVRLSPLGVDRLRHVMPNDAIREAVAAAGAPADDGWITATIPVESDHIGAAQLLGLAGEVEVVEPRAVRERLAAWGRALTAQNS